MYLSTLFKDFSRSYIQKMIDSGQVKINNEIINKNLQIKNKDEINITLKIQKLKKVVGENIKLDILFEDDNILVINKDAGINVHPVPGEGGNSGTIVNAILHHTKNKLPVINGIQRPGIVHRLDKDTSGIMLIAKNDFMMKYLASIIKERNINKYYIAIVYGKIKDKKIKIESYIGRDKINRQKMTVNDPINPKKAISFGEVLAYIDDKYTLLKIKIETGRTHQIRVHFSSIGFPILGDKIYGNPKINKEIEEKYFLCRQALHAYELDFKLYDRDIVFKAPLKDDMKLIIGDLFA